MLLLNNIITRHYYFHGTLCDYGTLVQCDIQSKMTENERKLQGQVVRFEVPSSSSKMSKKPSCRRTLVMNLQS